jgi:hypothetical protein
MSASVAAARYSRPREPQQQQQPEDHHLDSFIMENNLNFQFQQWDNHLDDFIRKNNPHFDNIIKANDNLRINLLRVKSFQFFSG